MIVLNRTLHHIGLLVDLIGLEVFRLALLLFYSRRGGYIGEGLQYMVYLSAPGQVRKLEKPLLLQIVTLWSWYGRFEISYLSKLSSLNLERRSVRHLIASLSNPKIANLFGSPKAAALGYFQDLCVTFGRHLQLVSSADRHASIVRLSLFERSLAAEGFFDKAMNPHVNFGVNSQGDLVCLDLGEVFADKAFCLETLRSESWRMKRFWGELAPAEEQIFRSALVDSLVEMVHTPTAQ
jgi:hypothetical protein